MPLCSASSRLRRYAPTPHGAALRALTTPPPGRSDLLLRDARLHWALATSAVLTCAEALGARLFHFLTLQNGHEWSTEKGYAINATCGIQDVNDPQRPHTA
jgi:hypothetical protein